MSDAYLRIPQHRAIFCWLIFMVLIPSTTCFCRRNGMLDRWIIDKARLIQEEILLAYQTYQFHVVVQSYIIFVWLI